MPQGCTGMEGLGAGSRSWGAAQQPGGPAAGKGPEHRPCRLPANPAAPHYPRTPTPTRPRPTWSHAEASDDADHTGDTDVARPGQGGLRGDAGLRDTAGVVAPSFVPSVPRMGLRACPSTWWQPSWMAAMQHVEQSW